MVSIRDLTSNSYIPMTAMQCYKLQGWTGANAHRMGHALVNVATTHSAHTVHTVRALRYAHVGIPSADENLKDLMHQAILTSGWK
jgi:hypothetical protein